MPDRAAATKAGSARARRAAILRSLERIDRMVAQWRRIAENEELAIEEQRPLRRPALRLETCEELRQMLLEELAQLDGVPPPRPPRE